MTAELPAEIWRIIASHLEQWYLLRIVAKDRYFAWLFDGFYYDSWRVNCCKAKEERSRGIQVRDREKLYETDIRTFFEGVKNGTAAAFARKVCFSICAHEDLEEDYGEEIDEDLPLESTAIELLNYCNEVVVSVEYLDYHYRILCNEHLIEHLLRKSLSELKNAVLKFRLEKPYKTSDLDDGYYDVTVHNSEMIPIVLSQIQPGCMTTNLWEECKLYRRVYPEDLGIHPNVKTLTSLSTCGIFTIEGLVRAFPQLETFTDDAMKHTTKRGCYLYTAGVTYHFKEQRCVRIVGHGGFYDWIKEFHREKSIMDDVKVLDFHHADTDPTEQYTVEIVKKLVSYILKRLPNLKTVLFKSTPGSFTCERIMRASITEIDASDFEIDASDLKPLSGWNVVDEIYEELRGK